MQIRRHTIKKNSFAVFTTNASNGPTYLSGIKNTIGKHLKTKLPICVMSRPALNGPQEDTFDIFEFEELSKEQLEALIKQFKK